MHVHACMCVYVCVCLLQMQTLMSSAGAHPAMMGWGGGVPWLLQENEGLVYKYGTDMHAIEHILRTKLRKFNAEESHTVCVYICMYARICDALSLYTQTCMDLLA